MPKGQGGGNIFGYVMMKMPAAHAKKGILSTLRAEIEFQNRPFVNVSKVDQLTSADGQKFESTKELISIHNVILDNPDMIFDVEGQPLEIGCDTSVER